MKWKFIKIQSDTTLLLITTGMLEFQIGDLGFYESSREMNWIVLELEAYEV